MIAERVLATQTGAHRVLDVLLSEGVDLAFGYPGGAIMPLYDALYGHRVRHVLVRHEAAAAFAAGGYARSSGRVGVCFATSGPGATNLITGLVDAMMDSIPVVAITGQVRTPLMGTDAFQEADIAAITNPITKRSIVVRDARELEPALRAAFRLARGPRPGPVLVDIPQDVLKAPLEMAELPPALAPTREFFAARMDGAATDHEGVARAAALIRGARRPLVIVGGGARTSDAVTEFRQLCALLAAPHTATINGLGCAAPDDRRFLGMLGMHGWKGANRAVGEADVIVALGMRFDDRVTGRPDRFAPRAKIVHIDIDAAEFGKIIPIEVAIRGDLRAALRALIAELSSGEVPRFDAWAREAQGFGGRPACDRRRDGMLSATDVLDEFFELAPAETIVSTDVGQHQMWAAQRARPTHPRNFLTSAGLGAMGFGFPAAIGALVANPRTPVTAIVGDGGFQMSLPELATLKRYDLPVKILLIDNRNLGMVRQWQQLFYDARYSATNLSDNPDFCGIAKAYGVRAESVENAEGLRPALERFIASREAFLLHCACFPEENVWPMIPAGAGIDQGVDGIAETVAR